MKLWAIFESSADAAQAHNARAANRDRVYTGDGCRHTGMGAVPAKVAAFTPHGPSQDG